MSYFVTGATGFIGRRLVQRLLDQRQGKVYVLVRGRSLGRLEDLIECWRIASGASAAKRIQPIVGDLRKPLLGLEQEQVNELRGKITHFFHLAAVYDMTAPAERNTAVNVGGTTHAVELARAIDAKHLHHVSSIAVAGAYRGTFTEEMFDEGQRLPSPYHRTKFEAERLVREQPFVPWRVYRRDGQGRRAVLLLQGDPAAAAVGARMGAARRRGPRPHERRAGRLGRRR